MSNLREFVQFAWTQLAAHKKLLCAIVVGGVIAGGLEGLGVTLFVPLLAEALPSAAHASALHRLLMRPFVAVAPAQRLMVVGGAMAAVIILRGTLGFITGLLYAELDRRISHKLRASIFQRCLFADFIAWERFASDDLFNTLTTEAPRIAGSIVGLVCTAVVAFTFALYVTILLLLSWKMTLAVVFVLGSLFWLNALLSRRVQRVSKLLTKLNRLAIKRQVEMFEGMKLIRACGREDLEQTRFEHVSRRLARAGFRMRMLYAALGPIRELGKGGLVLLLFVGATLFAKDLSAALIFLLVLNRLEPQARDLSAYALGIDSVRSSLIKVREAIATQGKFQMRFGPVSRPPLRDAVVFDRVSFCYGYSGPAAVDNLSLRLAKGETTAIVGQSGAGKSTVLRLLLRLLDPTQGEILVDDVPLSRFSRESLRERTSYVSQEAFLFDASVRWNLMYGAEDRSLSDLVKAATLAGAHEFIQALPDGYETRVGPRGCRLSGGERQRLLLARALLRKPDLLVLDEATSALDSISEEVVRRALDVLQHECAIVVVSHRLALVEHADNIVVMRAGQVVEQGRFAELIQGGGLFEQLHALQHVNTEQPTYQDA